MVMMHVTPEMQMRSLIRNSYRNFQAKGLDYLCLRRSNDLTVKVYFYNNGLTGGAHELVSPHDHRYDFSTQVLAGQVNNIVWEECGGGLGKPFNKFSFCTPLNGGTGFNFTRETFLRTVSLNSYSKNERYTMGFDEIHTLGELLPGTVLLVWQYRDIHPISVPSSTFVRMETREGRWSREPPSLDGLYDKFTEDQIIERLLQLEALQPLILQNHYLHTLAGLEYVQRD